VLDAPDENDTDTWRFQKFVQWWGPPTTADLKDPALRLKFLKERLAQLPDPFKTAWLALGDDEIIPIYPGQQWAPTMHWNNRGGRVTIAGDAAHSMLPSKPRLLS
jgi:2-polyprenyl-6-methoxyphenol hydroxylase-like FAD-dependent oxidoreductase